MILCPRCKSSNVEVVNYLGLRCIVCADCGYDERDMYEVYPEEKSASGLKGKFSPYKTGGKYRTTKLK